MRGNLISVFLIIPRCHTYSTPQVEDLRRKFMKSKNFAKKFVFGQVILEKTTSPINGEIYVTEDLLGGRRIVIGGLTQSGRIIEDIWDDGVKGLAKKPQKVLILGFGGGGAARVINRRFPQAEIVGVEIDHVIVEIARKYFDLPQIENLNLVINDAVLFIKECQEKFDLILVDLYQGQKIPRECQTDEFLNDVRLLLAPEAVAIFNHLYSRPDRIKAEYFEERLRRIFPKVSTLRSVANILFKTQN